MRRPIFILQRALGKLCESATPEVILLRCWDLWAAIRFDLRLQKTRAPIFLQPHARQPHARERCDICTYGWWRGHTHMRGSLRWSLEQIHEL